MGAPYIYDISRLRVKFVHVTIIITGDEVFMFVVLTIYVSPFINSSLLAMTLYSSVKQHKFITSQNIHSLRDVLTELECI